MGEMSNGTTPGSDARDSITQVNDGEFQTDVEGVMSNGQKNNLHVFDIDKENFFKNMKDDRKRQRFGTDSAATKYLRGTKYRVPFFVRYKDENGDAFIRKVK